MKNEQYQAVLQALQAQGYTLDGAAYSTGRPNRVIVSLSSPAGAPLVAKLYPAGGGERTYAQMRQLWRSSFGERRKPPGLPKPVDFLPDPGVLLMECVAGNLCVHRNQLDDETLQGIVAVVAALHDSDVEPLEQRDANRMFRSVRHKANGIADMMPQAASSVTAVVDALELTIGQSGQLVPTHGDCSPRNIVVGPRRIVLIDWDRFERAEPARDIAHLGAWYWVWLLRQGKTPDWSVLERMVSWYRLLRPHAEVEKRLSFYVAARLVRTAHRILVEWPEESHLVPKLAAEALARLKEAPFGD
jgi:hypothetical protein